MVSLQVAEVGRDAVVCCSQSWSCRGRAVADGGWSGQESSHGVYLGWWGARGSVVFGVVSAWWLVIDADGVAVDVCNGDLLCVVCMES